VGPSRNGAKLGCRNQYGHRYALVLDTDISGAFDPVGVVSGPFDPAGVAAVTPGRVGLVNDLGPPDARRGPCQEEKAAPLWAVRETTRTAWVNPIRSGSYPAPSAAPNINDRTA